MVKSLPDELLDAKTPDEVDIRMKARQPDFDPTLGVAVTPKAASGASVNRLVAIGDSLTHGFQSGAIFNTRNSWPMIVAWELGWDSSMRYPTHDGFGGLPLNIEYLIRHLESKYGEKISWWEAAFAAFEARHVMAQIEDWWERGPGSHVPQISGIMHNLAVYGWDLRDALSRDATNLTAAIGQPKNNVLSQIVENANERAALRVYASAKDAAGSPLTVLAAAKALGDQGATLENGKLDPAGDGIETLVVFLGANNALGAIVSLRVKWSDVGYDTLGKKDAFTVWRPTHFATELTLLVAELKKVKARHVIVCNVPHVTIAPLARGVATKVRPDSRYFPYYTRPWITDQQFNPNDDPNITGQEARAIDSAIDQYNVAIADAVKQARVAKLDWYLLDVAGILDRLAARRYFGQPRVQPAWWTPYELPPELAALKPTPPDSRFFVSGPHGREQGGLFSLYGVHPTTITYGIIAQEVINVMQRAGVTFYLGDGKTKRQGPVRVDFNRLLRLDTLISDPPRSLSADLKLIGWLDETVDVFRRILRNG